MITKSSFLGNKQFYKHVFIVMLPVLLQNVVTNFVSLLDNIMVGQVGTEPMSGVAIANQLIFVFNLCIFGGISGAAIFTAQYFGKGDEDGIRYTIRIKMYIATFAAIAFAIIFWLKGGELINAFLHEGNEGLDLKATFGYSLEYLHVMMIQLIPFALMQVYAGTLRETRETVLPMKASFIAVAINLVGNYVLIYGKFGAPKLGVLGAAIATVIARFVECIILMVYAHKKTDRFPFFKGVYSSFIVPLVLVKQVAKKGTPLLLNELLWSAGQAMLNQCYSMRGLEVVSATNISSTISNLFCCAIFASGSTITIIIGQHLGAGRLKEAVEDDKKIIVLSMAMCIIIGGVLALTAPLLAGVYNTTDAVKGYATQFLIVAACFMPFNAFTNNCYFTLRSGGKTIITFIFDSVFSWCGFVPLAFVLSRFTNLPILPIFIIVNSLELIKCVIGFLMLKSKTWVVNLVGTK